MALFDTHRQRMYGYIACAALAVLDVVFIVKYCDVGPNAKYYLSAPLAIETAIGSACAVYEKAMDSLQKGTVSLLDKIAPVRSDSSSVEEG